MELSGTDAFLSPISCKKSPASRSHSVSSLHSKGWIWTVANQGRNRKEITRGKIRGTRNLIKIRRQSLGMIFREHQPAHTLVLSETLPLNHSFKTPHQVSEVETESFFWSRSPVCLPLPGKVILFYFIKILSPGFNLALIYKESELSVIVGSLKLESWKVWDVNHLAKSAYSFQMTLITGHSST